VGRLPTITCNINTRCPFYYNTACLYNTSNSARPCVRGLLQVSRWQRTAAAGEGGGAGAGAGGGVGASAEVGPVALDGVESAAELEALGLERLKGALTTLLLYYFTTILHTYFYTAILLYDYTIVLVYYDTLAWARAAQGYSLVEHGIA
jgi:hypothetical protein